MAKTGQADELYTNNRWVLRFVVVDEDVPGEPPLDITGHTIYFALTKLNTQGNPIAASPVIDKNSTAHPTEVVITDASQGEVDVILDESVTVAVRPGEYYVELEDKDALGNPVVVMTGNLTVLPNVSNA